MKEKNTSVAAWKLRLMNTFSKFRIPAKITFIIVGIVSVMWFLFRVIPKPQRATYPCVRATAPLASAFVIYIIGIAATVFSFKKVSVYFRKSRYALALVFIFAGATFAFITIPFNNNFGKAADLNFTAFAPNDPIGVAKGIMPGRVVWVYDADATDKTCTNTSGDYWYQNTDLEVVEGMFFSGIKNVAGSDDIYEAWDAIFKYFNNNHGKGEVGYAAGEKIVVKINLTTSQVNEDMNATPEAVLALLKQLIEIVGVEESDITIGDPYRPFTYLYWNMCHAIYPDVHYVDGNGGNGREQTEPSASDELIFSDGEYTSRLPQSYLDADYMINMACLKTHNEGGITLCAKNHQGSYLADDQTASTQYAINMHYPLPANDQGHGKYRHLVDYMGHEKMGGNTLLFIVDGIWAGRNWEGIIEKWNMEPFNGDYPSSLFMSQDPVAIESVGYDFLLEEYKDKPENIQYPYIDGVDDYLLQAADPANWPAGIDYDPEGDGSVLASLGTHEHWNNATDKQYSRNLESGDGIELFQTEADMDYSYNSVKSTSLPENLKIYPQPASEQLTVEFTEGQAEIVSVQLMDISGRNVLNSNSGQDKSVVILNLDSKWNGNYILSIRTNDGMTYSTQVVIQ